MSPNYKTTKLAATTALIALATVFVAYAGLTDRELIPYTQACR